MTSYTSRPRGSARADFLAQHAQVLSIATFFVLCLVIFSLISEAFFSAGNILNLLRQSSPLLIAAVAMTFVITTGGIDLSIGSTVALVNALAAIALQAAIPWPIVIVLLLVTGAFVGWLQGWFVAFEAIPAFIVTLAGLSVLRGIALLMTQGFSIPISPDSFFVQLGRGCHSRPCWLYWL
jgi:simple sugar transport system permease protein